ncbi:MAG: hypothetical protein LW817_05655 [Candidatus Caenarcaniphilales bacterium]|nr:hypothetical protein [Candidatus Caenarcaniphilales bacterium]
MPLNKASSKIYYKKRSERGFTLFFAVVLCVTFAGLLFMVFYFLKLNTAETLKNLNRQQAYYIAESGNNRAMAQLNVKSLPDIDLADLEVDENDPIAEDDPFDDEGEFFDEDMEDDFFGDDEDFDEEEKVFLAKIPRYINFYLKNPFFVNIDSGQIISEAQYYSMINQQQARIQTNKQAAEREGETYQVNEILIEELFFPLPEVNVQKIGNIKFEKGTHLKPGIKILLAEKSPIKLKQKDIIDEYTGEITNQIESRPRAILRAISPNYIEPGEQAEVKFDGDNLEGVLPEFNSADLVIFRTDEAYASIAATEQAKPGKIRVKLGPNQADFFIVPAQIQDYDSPIINDVILEKPLAGSNQFTYIGNKDKIEGVKIKGEFLSNDNLPPVIVPDGHGISIDIVSFTPNEIIVNISTAKPSAGLHYFSIFTQGGQSTSWSFNVESPLAESNEDPFTATYSTVLTLLEVNSLSNLPIRSLVESSARGRPASSGDDNASGNSKRPASATQADSNAPRRKNFDLLRSDLELVWKAETVSTVNKKSYKETRIIRRSVPRAEAALITNTELSFGQSSLVIEGQLEAQTKLRDYTSTGDKEIPVEGESPEDLDTRARSEDDDAPRSPIGSAVIEELGLGKKDKSPASKGFTTGGIVSIVSQNRSNSYSDFGFVESMGPDYIVVREPGFQESHFTGDELIQFIPAVITPEELSERDAQRSLDPPGAVAYVPGRLPFEYVFRTQLRKLIAWSENYTSDTSVPNDINQLYEGYFGLNIIEGVPSYTGANALYGQGALIIDTTSGGRNPFGGVVTIGGSSKIPSMFEGVIYIIGGVQIVGPVEIAGAIIVNAPGENVQLRLGGSGNITYDENAIRKSILHLPFTEEQRTRRLETAKSQEEILDGTKKK